MCFSKHKRKKNTLFVYFGFLNVLLDFIKPMLPIELAEATTECGVQFILTVGRISEFGGLQIFVKPNK